MKVFFIFAIFLGLFLNPALGTRILFLGDSLTAGYGLDPEQAFPHLVGEALRVYEEDLNIVNAGVSGDTTAGGLRRIDWIMKIPADVLFLSLGANDALRGFPPSTTYENLSAIIQKARQMNPDIYILLGGMLAPPNMGDAYVNEFKKIYPRLTDEFNLELVPFLLEGVAGEADLNLADGIHPNAKGHQIIANQLIPYLVPILKAHQAHESTQHDN